MQAPPAFKVAACTDAPRTASGRQGFTDYDSFGGPYYLGSDYKIAPKRIDAARTVFSKGGASDITYRLSQSNSTDFFVNSGNGVIYGKFDGTLEPGNYSIALVAVDKGGQADKLETYTFHVQSPRVFSVKAREDAPRADERDGFTDYDKFGGPYYLGSDYKIAPQRIDSNQTVFSAGSASDVTYRLDQTNTDFFVNSGTGVIFGKFDEAMKPGTYTIDLVAIDKSGQSDTLQTYTFDVQAPIQFGIRSSAKWNSTSSLGAGNGYRSSFRLGSSYDFMPISMEKYPPSTLYEGASGQGEQIVYFMEFTTVQNGTARISSTAMDILVGAAGKAKGVALKAGQYTGHLKARDANNAGTAVLKEWRFEVLRRDDVELATTASNEAVSVLAVCLGVVIVAVALVAGVKKHRKQKTANAPADFIAQLQMLKDAGLIDPVQSDRVPRELKRGWVTTIDQLGQGMFGEVWKGLLADKGSTVNVPEYMVAIKIVHKTSDSHGNASTGSASSTAPNVVSAEEDLFKEALLMAQVESHANLVSLVGVVTRGQPKMLVLSFCEHGELEGQLKKRAANGEPFDLCTKFRFCSEIAAGMSLLASNNFVHRDLATRNVLLASGMTCKVADFGMSRRVLTDDNASNYYRTTSDLLPVRWTAPEGLIASGGKFSSASDVWSFGITCIEVIEDGQTPWFHVRSNASVMAMVSAGQMHPQPAGCSDEVYAKLVQCFGFEADDRPAFPRLQEFFARRAEPDNRVAMRDTGSVLLNPGLSEQNTAANVYCELLAGSELDSTADALHAGQGTAGARVNAGFYSSISGDRKTEEMHEDAYAMFMKANADGHLGQQPPLGQPWRIVEGVADTTGVLVDLDFQSPFSRAGQKQTMQEGNHVTRVSEGKSDGHLAQQPRRINQGAYGAAVGNDDDVPQQPWRINQGAYGAAVGNDDDVPHQPRRINQGAYGAAVGNDDDVPQQPWRINQGAYGAVVGNDDDVPHQPRRNVQDAYGAVVGNDDDVPQQPRRNVQDAYDAAVGNDDDVPQQPWRNVQDAYGVVAEDNTPPRTIRVSQL